VAKVVVVALAVIAAALLLAIIVLHVRETLRWLAASVFIALALAPAVAFLERHVRVRGRHLPRWLAIIAVYVIAFLILVVIVLEVVPPLIREVGLLAQTLPGYVGDFESWAERNQDFQELNRKFDLTRTLNEQATQLPSHVGDAANEIKVISVSLLRNILGAVTVAVISFFMLLGGRELFANAAHRLAPPHADRTIEIGRRIAGVVRGYVTVNLTLAIAAGVFTWLVLELLGVDIAVPLAIIVAFLDLVPLIGLTIGGVFVAIIAAIHSPTALIVWVVLFLIYQQVQDRVVQPMMYGRAVSVHPLVAIVVLLMGAQIAGILGALLAIPTAAAIGVVIGELAGWNDEPDDEPGAASEPGASPASEPSPAA
jgi:predicted PurR-regulated permease PerM